MHHVWDYKCGVEEHKPLDVVTLGSHHRRNDTTLAGPEKVNILVTLFLEMIDNCVEVIAFGEDRHPSHIITEGTVVRVKGVGRVALPGKGTSVISTAVARIPQTVGKDNKWGR